MTNDNNVLLLRQADFELSHTTACAVLASFLCDGAVLNCFCGGCVTKCHIRLRFDGRSTAYQRSLMS